MSIEVLKQALEALEYIDDGANNQGAHTGISWRCVSNKAQPAITSLRQAIAEAEQEPKREWVVLTDEERNQLWRDVIKWGDPSHDDVDLMKAIEAKLKEKNT